MSIESELKKLRKSVQAIAQHDLPGGVVRYSLLLTREESEAELQAEMQRRAVLWDVAGLPKHKRPGFLVVPRRGELAEWERASAANMLEPRD